MKTYQPSLKAGTVLAVVTELYGVTIKELLGRGLSERVVKPRHIAQKLLMDAGYSSREIGRRMGRNHSTVRHAKRCVEHWMEQAPAHRRIYQEIFEKAERKQKKYQEILEKAQGKQKA